MKIIYTTEEDFIKQEIAEHGYEYIDAQFAMGYEPGLVHMPSGKSFWAWVESDDVLRILSSVHDCSNTCGGSLSTSHSSISSSSSVLVH